MKKRLPLHPRPRLGESIGFYAVRLADCMGYSSASQLLSATGMLGQRLLAVDNWRLMEHLVEITGHSEHQFREACFDETLAYAIDDSNWHYTRLALKAPHICPSCMSRDRVAKSHWQYLPRTHCDEHGQRLLSTCPTCGEPFKWDVGLLSIGCSHCGTQWAGMVRAEAKVPGYQVAFNETNKLKKTEQFVHDLMVAAKKALRPFDLIIDQAPITNTIDDWTPVLSRAFKMLSDRDFIASWEAQCSKKLSALSVLGLRGSKAPIESLANAVSGDWEICCERVHDAGERTPLIPMDALTCSVTKSRIVTQKDGGLDEQLRVQADLKTAAKLVGCNPSDITILWEKGAIESVNAPNQQRYAFFDLLSFANSLALKVRQNAQGLIKFSDILDWLRLFETTLGDVLVAVANGDIPFHIDLNQDTLVDGLSVSPKALYRVLNKQFKKNPEKEYPRYRLPRIVGMSKIDLDEMTRERAIQATPSHGEGVFRKQQLVDLTGKYFLAIRWARLRQQKLAKVRHKLRDAGVAPLYGRNVYPLAEARAALRMGV